MFRLRIGTDHWCIASSVQWVFAAVRVSSVPWKLSVCEPAFPSLQIWTVIENDHTGPVSDHKCITHHRLMRVSSTDLQGLPALVVLRVLSVPWHHWFFNTTVNPPNCLVWLWLLIVFRRVYQYLFSFKPTYFQIFLFWRKHFRLIWKK